MRKYALLLAITTSTLATAMTNLPQKNWLFSAAMGYSNTSSMMSIDGQSASARLALGYRVPNNLGVTLTTELGVQSGAHMRLALSAAEENILGDTAVQTTLMPMIDLLLTARKSLNESIRLSGYLKAGFAYRSMHFDRDTINDLRKVSPEVHVGMSMPISNNACLSLGYQGVLSSNIHLTTTGSSGTGIGNVKNIPSMHGILLTVGYKA